MIEYTRGNLLEADVEALVNTVNTVGVMGKGIALMFKEAFPGNFKAYKSACDAGEVETGRVLVHERNALVGPRWIINFPTKQHWRGKTRMEWIEAGLSDLRRVIVELGISSVAVPPLGCGQGGLEWASVQARIEQELKDLAGVRVMVYEPTHQYQNVAKRSGVEKLTPARALIAELVRRYWILGMECSLLEVHKLAWFMTRRIRAHGLDDPLKLDYKADRFGPYAHRLQHLLNSLEGSYLHCDRRIPDARPHDVIWFDVARAERVALYLKSGEARQYMGALQDVESIIDGFQSPRGLELLATVDWLLVQQGCQTSVSSIRHGLRNWPKDESAARRKDMMFSDEDIDSALRQLSSVDVQVTHESR
jgi:O-acetyl-ADP-ribose deacetylase (regulator of RNase III)